MDDCKFTAKQKSKELVGDKLKYVFQVFRDGEQHSLYSSPIPKRTEKGEFILNEKGDNWVYEEKPVPVEIILMVEAGATKEQLEAAVMRQLLEFKIAHRCKKPCLVSSPDLHDTITVD